MLLTRLSRPYLHGEALPAKTGNQHAEVQVNQPFVGRIAPTLSISLPTGDLPQEVVLDKEECREWFADIELAESKVGGGVAVLRYSNVALVATVNASHDDVSGGSLALFPLTTEPGPMVAEGLLHSWPQFREAVRQVATHPLPSLTEYKQRTADDQ